MEITEKWLNDRGACEEGMRYFESSHMSDGISIIKKLMTDEAIKEIENKYDGNALTWANWLIVRILTKQDAAKYAVYAAELVLHVFEEKYPEDKRPRNALVAAKNYIDNPTDDNKKILEIAAAYNAPSYGYDAAAAYDYNISDDAYDAAAAAAADDDAAAAAAYVYNAAYADVYDAASYAYDAAAYAAAYAYDAVYADNAAAAVGNAAAAVGNAAAAITNATYKKILQYGLTLIIGKV